MSDIPGSFSNSPSRNRVNRAGRRTAPWLISAAFLVGSVGGLVTTAPSAGATDCLTPARRITINGGTSSNVTNVNVSADGGTAISDASGGDDNIALGILGDASAGNGGTATSQANGGAIALGDINSGNNTGNVIRVGSTQPKPKPCVGPRIAGTSGQSQAARATSPAASSSRVVINGGTSTNTTNVNLSANGGTALSDASGGDDNLAIGLLGNANAGNGGTATSQANGGAIVLGDINSGGNTGNVIRVGNISGSAQINGGTSSNITNVNVSANGGTALSDASGGDDNIALGIGILGGADDTNAAAGNSGTANSSANGGAISIGDINSGNNTGNVIQTGDLSGNASIDGGTSSNTTNINASANGGTALSDASGGDDNIAVSLEVVEAAPVQAPQPAEQTELERQAEEERKRAEEAGAIEPAVVAPVEGAIEDGAVDAIEPAAEVIDTEANAGNGGTADTDANGGAISAGDVSSGDNTGNVIETGDE